MAASGKTMEQYNLQVDQEYIILYCILTAVFCDMIKKGWKEHYIKKGRFVRLSENIFFMKVIA